MQEPAIADDPTSTHPELGGGYIAYSASGTATGQVVFVNYGLPADYAKLRAEGISVKDRIALARYGRSHRAVKVHTAQEAGARALILYSDPADDGEVKGPVWPKGYWRGADMLQRGNAKLSWFWHGDPLTPGVARHRRCRSVSMRRGAPTLPKIPVVVISANEAAAVRVSDARASGPRTRPPCGIAVGHGSAPPADLQRGRVAQGPRPTRSTRSCSAPITTRGRLAASIPAPGGGAARSGERPRHARKIGMAAGAHASRSRSGMRRSSAWSARPNTPRQFRTTLQEQLIAYVNTDMYMKGRFDAGGVPSLREFVTEEWPAIVPGNHGRTPSR